MSPCERSAREKDKAMSILKVGQKKTYRIQKDAMTEFGYDLKFAMKGGYWLDDQYLVWFPNLVNSETDQFQSLFGDVLKDNGKTMVEIAPDDKRLERILRDTSTLRITFARFKGYDYEFKGVFKYDEVDMACRKVFYKRIAEALDTSKWQRRK